MIRFLEDEYDVDGKRQWVEITSEWGDIVAFAMGGEQVGERFSDEDPIALYALEGQKLLGPLRFVEEGVKAEWMGKPAGPYESGPFSEPGPQVQMQFLDFEQDAESVTIILKRYNLGDEEHGHNFSYTMPKEDFRTLASAVASMTQYSA